MKLATVFVCPLFLAVGASLLRVQTSQAVPVFARRESAKYQMCHLRLPELNEDGHAYVCRGLREERGGMAPQVGMVMGTREAEKAPVSATDRPLGEALPLQWQHYLELKSAP